MVTAFTIHENGPGEGLGAGEHQGSGAGLDEVGHGGGHGAVVGDAGVDGHRSGRVLMKNHVPRRAEMR
jgi:hypothetical protein